MADFCEADPAKIRDELMRERVQYLKTSPEGVRSMCEIMEEALEQERERTRQQVVLDHVRKLVKTLELTAQQALDALEIPKSEQARYLSML